MIKVKITVFILTFLWGCAPVSYTYRPSEPSDLEISACANVLSAKDGGENYYQAKRICRNGGRYRPLK